MMVTRQSKCTEYEDYQGNSCLFFSAWVSTAILNISVLLVKKMASSCSILSQLWRLDLCQWRLGWNRFDFICFCPSTLPLSSLVHLSLSLSLSLAFCVTVLRNKIIFFILFSFLNCLFCLDISWLVSSFMLIWVLLGFVNCLFCLCPIFIHTMFLPFISVVNCFCSDVLLLLLLLSSLFV